MAHHANYAAVIGIKQSLAQSILHIYYTDGEFPATLKGKHALPDKLDGNNDPLPKRYLTYDLFMAEPRLNFEKRNDNRISVHLRFVGTVELTSASIESIKLDVQLDLKVSGVLEIFDADTSIQIGIAILKNNLEDFKLKRFKGPDPSSTFSIHLVNDLRPLIAGAILLMDTSAWRISPPQLDDIRAAGFVPEDFPEVQQFGSSISVGIDIAGQTNGEKSKLIDLFNTPLDQGFYRVFSESGSSYDDEYGGQYTEAAWSSIKRKSKGKHGTTLAAAMNDKIIQSLFNKKYGPEIIARFEEIKQEKIDKAHKKAEDENKEFKKPKIAKVTINELKLQLIDDFVRGYGEAHYDWGNGITVDFDIRFRFLNTYVDGSTNFVYNNYKVVGLKIEIQSVEIDEPWWVDFITVMTGIGFGLAPASIVVSGILLAVLKAVIGSKRQLGESKIEKGLIKRIGEFGGKLKFVLPRTDGPTFNLSIEDFVVDADGFDMWVHMSDGKKTGAKLRLKKYPFYTRWPVKDRNDIEVELINKYNFSHPADMQVRIRWEVYAGEKCILIVQRDTRLKKSKLGQQAIDPKSISIAHASEELEAYEYYLVRCRVYRPFGDSTTELYKSEIKITVDDRLKRHKPYVQWTRGVYFRGYTHKVGHPKREPMGWMREMRHFAIHKTDPDERCMFADMYTMKLNKNKLIYLDELPFPKNQIKNHLDKVCEYCFFGGPDKVNQEPKVEVKPKRRFKVKRFKRRILRRK
jgi:hypothetical protein